MKDVSTNPARVIARYGYNGEGQRVRKTGGNTAYYVYGLDGEVAQEYSGAFDVGGTRYVIADHLGSTRMTLDEAGQPVTRHDFEPYGVEIDRSGAGYGAPETVTRLFTGKERDFEEAGSANVSGFDYFGARYFSGAQGRFTSPDPLFFQKEMIEDPQRWNLYTYVRNNPLKYVDPSGEEIELLGDEEQRKKALAALQSAVGEKAGQYLTEQRVKGTNKYMVSISDQKAFANGNAVAGEFAAIINDKKTVGLGVVGGTEKLPDGTTLQGEGTPGLTANFGGILGTTIGSDLRVYVLDPREDYSRYSLAGRQMSDRLPSDALISAWLRLTNSATRELV